jgi:transcription elongation factor Elf1
MAKAIQQVAGVLKRTWECKQCHQQIADDCTVAYHLIEGILYGWCDFCFIKRNEISKTMAERAAAASAPAAALAG